MGGGEKFTPDRICGLLSTLRPEAIPLCHQIAQQCDEQKLIGKKTFAVCDPSDTQCYASDSYSECLKSSTMLAFKLTSDRKDASSSDLVPQSGLDAIRRAIGPFRVTNNSGLMETKARRLLAEHGLIREGEQISQVLNGRVVDAYESSGETRPLVTIFLDDHYSADAREQIVEALQGLQPRGLHLVGLENVPEGHRLLPASEQADCDEANLLMPVIGCKLGSKMFVFGTEQPDLFERNKKQLIEIFGLLASGEKVKMCKGVDGMKEALASAHLRSHHIATYLPAVMTHFQSKVVALTIGSFHLVDLQAEFEQRNVSYIAVAVAAVDKWIEGLKNFEAVIQENCNGSGQQHNPGKATERQSSSTGCSMIPLGARP